MPGMNYSDLQAGSNRLSMLGSGYALTTAVTGVTPGNGAATGVTSGVAGAKYVAFESIFSGTVTGGTSATVYLQTSLDGGATWFDIASHAYANTATNKTTSSTIYIAPAAQGFTGTDGSLTANTIIQGVLGDRFRVKITSVGTYAAGVLKAYLVVKG